MNALTPGDRVILCLDCRYRFTEVEMAGASLCPHCESNGVPADLRKSHTITLSDHEWRVLFMWAERWAGRLAGMDEAGMDDLAGNPLMVILGIAECARLQQPSLPALTLAAEVRAAAFANAGLASAASYSLVGDPAEFQPSEASDA